MTTGCDAVLRILHESFVAFSEVLTTQANSWETCKTKLHELEDTYRDQGLFGANTLGTINHYQGQIAWQDMAPEQYSKFYRFVFYVCREPGKRNIPMSLAVSAWRLIMPGRFRLLERWCAFAAASSSRVVTEDTWRQVLDFSRTIHEDLSNYDSSGAWAVLLDEFVEELRSSRRRSPYISTADGGSRTLYVGNSGELLLLASQTSCGSDGGGGDTFAAHGRRATSGGVSGDATAFVGGDPPCLARLSPRCGSKRRETDVDMVAEQLSAMPLGVGQQQAHGLAGGRLGGCCGAGADYQYGSPETALTKRLCVAHQQPLSAQQQPNYPVTSAHEHLMTQGQQISQGHHHRQQQPLHQDAHQQHFPSPDFVVSMPSIGLGGGAGGGGGRGGCGGHSGNAGFGNIRASASSSHPMSCSEGSMDSECSLGPAGAASTAAMEGGCQDAVGLVLPPYDHHNPQQQLQQQQRRAVKARRSGLSDIVKSAVSDALGL